MDTTVPQRTMEMELLTAGEQLWVALQWLTVTEANQILNQQNRAQN